MKINKNDAGVCARKNGEGERGKKKMSTLNIFRIRKKGGGAGHLYEQSKRKRVTRLLSIN